MAFTFRQQKFIDEYLRSGNAAKAARTAGYSERTAKSIGHENLTKPDIAEEISRRMSAEAMSPNEVLWRLGRQARGDLADFLSGDGDDIHVDLDKAEGMTDLIKTLTVKRVTRRTLTGEPTTTATVRIELHDAQAALRDIGRAHRLFVDGVDVTGAIDVNNVAELSDDELARIASSGGE